MLTSVPGAPELDGVGETVAQDLGRTAAVGVDLKAGPKGSWSNARRWQALVEHAKILDLNVVQIGNFPPKTTSGAAAADAAVNSAVTACSVLNYLISIAILQRLAERGIPRPEPDENRRLRRIFEADFCNLRSPPRPLRPNRPDESPPACY